MGRLHIRSVPYISCMAAAAPFQVTVSGLAPSRSEDSLRSLFSQHGTVQKVTITAGGQATIMFTEKSAAEAAVVALNGKVLDGLEIKVVLEGLAVGENASVHIRDLPKECTESALREVFVRFGPIQSVRVEVGKGYGFVQFESSDAATRAISEGGVQMMGARVRVERFIPKTERKSATSSVYVRGFDASFTEQQLKTVFLAYGEISSCTINKDSQGSRVYGFVNFVQQESADAALRLNGTTTEGISWFVSPAAHPNQTSHSHRPQTEDWSRRNIYISGFPAYVTQTNIQALCQTFGEIESIRMQQRSPGYGFEEADQGEGCGAFVLFRREQDADAAVAALRHTLIERCRVKVSKWKPLETRKVFGMPPALMAQWPFGMPFGFYPPPPSYRYERPQHFHGQRRPQQKHVPVPVPQAQPPQPQQAFPVFDVAKYNALPSANEKKRMIGEHIFYQLNPKYKESTGKITGMLLEMSPTELLDVAQNPAALQLKASEAMEVLKHHAQATKG